MRTFEAEISDSPPLFIGIIDRGFAMAKGTNVKIMKRPARHEQLKDHGTKFLGGFMEFVRTQGVVGLAVGLVLGGVVTVLVKSLIDNIVMPPLGFILGSAQGLKGLEWNLGKTPAGQETILHYGVFLNDLINFIVIAIVIYLVVHILGFDELDKKK
jgi:large conductance mechanosensitive channel